MSPQVLRLQSQAYKKSKVIEYWAAVEKKLEEFVDVTQQNDKNEIKAKDALFEKNAELINNKIASNKGSNGLKNGKSSKGINIGTLKEIQSHLTPSLIDTNLVHGQIVQVI